ncbi:hypothetical protein LTR66_015259, partial [Elasticomyces elasticus]
MRLFASWASGLAFAPFALAFWPYSDATNSAELSASRYSNDKPNVKVETLFQFPNNGSWVDNLVVRSDGNLLLTRLDTPEVWHVNTTSGNATLAYSFPNVTSCFGISEIADDVFAVVIGNFSAKTYEPTSDERALQEPTASEIAAVPEADALNGMATFSREPGLVLVADSIKGVVWKVNTETGDYAVALNDTTMLPAKGPLPLGINSVTVLD